MIEAALRHVLDAGEVAGWRKQRGCSSIIIVPTFRRAPLFLINYKLGITNFHWESETKVVCNLYIDKIITNKNKKRKQIFNRNSVVLLTDFEYNYSAFKNSFMESVSSNIMNRIWKPDSKKLREKVGLSDENFDELLNPLYENITTKILGCYANLEND